MRIEQNRDNEWVMPIGCIGFVDEVNGPGAKEVPEFVPTKHELLQLVKYWEEVWLDNEFFWFWAQQIGSTDRRLVAFADARIARIADAVGIDDVKNVIDEVWKTFEQTQKDDPRVWNCFKEGRRLPERVAEKVYRGQPVTDADWSDGPTNNLSAEGEGTD